MIAAIRLRGSVKVRKEIKDTMDMLGLKRVNTMVVVDDKKEIMGMIKKVENFVTWGEISDELKKKFDIKEGEKKIIHLHPPRKGLRSIKRMYPKGDLGYRGEKINDLIKRMLVEENVR